MAQELNTDFSNVDSARVALYFQRFLFYAIYPNFYSANAPDHSYWEDPRLFNRDRALFKEYVPIMQRISAAGWEPVAWAHSSRPSVWPECYGTTYLAVLNSEVTPAQTRVLSLEITRPSGSAVRMKGRTRELTAQIIAEADGRRPWSVSLG